MKKSKFVNQRFGNWVCTACFLAANYSGGTKHNAYRYQLKRLTHDGKYLKSITVSGATMTKISKSQVSVDRIAINKKKSTRNVNEVLYQFVD